MQGFKQENKGMNVAETQSTLKTAKECEDMVTAFRQRALEEVVDGCRTYAEMGQTSRSFPLNKASQLDKTATKILYREDVKQFVLNGLTRLGYQVIPFTHEGQDLYEVTWFVDQKELKT